MAIAGSCSVVKTLAFRIEAEGGEAADRFGDLDPPPLAGVLADETALLRASNEACRVIGASVAETLAQSH